MNNFLRCSFILLLALTLGFEVLAFSDNATLSVLDEQIMTRIQREVSGSICFEHVRKLSALHRIWGSGDYHQAAQYVVDRASAYGLKGAVIEAFPIRTGRENFWTQSTGGYVPWDCKNGELRLVNPTPRLISDYESAPSTVAVGSRSAQAVSEVVYVGRGDSVEAYEGKDVRGKIALAEGGRHEGVHEMAVHRFGALGTIHFSNARGSHLESEGIYWGSISPWNKDRTRPSTFGFNISSTQGQALKDLLSKGEKVVVSVRIQAQIVENGSFELATALIPGSKYPEEEFIFYAHLDHPKPGAHDNASGDAVLLEIARTLARLIDNQIIPAPKRSIRFMWIPHMSGLNMYFSAHPEKIGKVKGGCNIDCVGVDPAKFPAKFYVALPPHSLYSPLADIAANVISRFNQGFDQAVIEGDDEALMFSPEGSRNLFSVTLVPYQGGSDEYTANTRSLNIPSLYFFEEPLPPRHNQINFLDYIDSTNLGRVAYLGALVSYTFASAGPETAAPLLNEIGFRGVCRIRQELVKAISLIERSRREDLARDLAQGENLLDWGSKREKRAARNLKEMIQMEKGQKRLMSLYEQRLDQEVSSAKKELKTVFDLRCAELQVKPGSGFALQRPSAEGAAIPVPNTLIKGSPGYFSNYFEDILGDDFLKKYQGVRSSFRYGNVGYYETMNYIDGHNTIAEIFSAVQAELWSEGYAARNFMTFQETVNYLRMLKDARVIEFKDLNQAGPEKTP